MPRVKRGTLKAKHRRKLLSYTKGYSFGRKSKTGLAKEAFMHAGAYSKAHRRDKKGDFRTLWNVKVNAAARADGFSYSEFIHMMKTKNIALNRKVLSEIAEHSPKTFSRIVAQAK